MKIKQKNGVVFLTPEFAHFKAHGEFLALELTCELSLLSESELDVPRHEHYDRVRLRRAFPFTLDESFISVFDTEQNEIGLIEDITVFPTDELELLRGELERVYYYPRILSIRSVKEKLGFTYFNVVCDTGELEIPVKDVYRSIIRLGDDSIAIIDNDGNRYRISSLSELAPADRRKLELYI